MSQKARRRRIQALFDNGDLADYVYWGDRLAAPHALMRERPPRNVFERWMKWQTSESNAFAVALAALLISVVVGILSLALAAFQAWIAWVAWRGSVADSDDETTALLREIADLLRQRPLR
ncbi:uncharacterized protein B0T15DRAFT_515109 [Chaetomium strumarium]|uniref:Uncharacterized protein n=1 Tax=Chaetomium strumarium TaxID=1170767 RepID=A0AAJ0GKZ0_9PEZI|nr:hypothetical protein B0T15DRAFT_515109 [Chaetomium strumarium]